MDASKWRWFDRPPAARPERPFAALAALVVLCTCGRSGGEDGDVDPGTDDGQESMAEVPREDASDANGDDGSADDPGAGDADGADWSEDGPDADGGTSPCGPGGVRVTPPGRSVGGSWDVWGDYLAYTLNYSGPLSPSALLVRNVVTGEEVELCESPGRDPMCTNGQIWGSQVAYAVVERSEEAGRSMMRRRLFLVRTDGSGEELLQDATGLLGEMFFDQLLFNGRKVLWCVPCLESNGMQNSIHVLDVTTREETVIADGTYPERVFGLMDMWEDRLVFDEVIDSASVRVLLYDLSTGATTPIGDSPYDHHAPRIWEDRVVWADSRNEVGIGDYWAAYNPDIYVRFLDGSPETGRMVETEGSIQASPDIHGDWVVWDDERNDTTPHVTDYADRLEVFAHNLATGETRMLTEGVPGRGGSSPRVWGNRAFFNRGVEEAREYTVCMVELE